MAIQRSLWVGAVIITVIVIPAVALAGCAPERPNAEFTASATVTWVDLVGGFYGLVLNEEVPGVEGFQLEPINLPEEFQHDGLAIQGTFRILEDWASIYMWGVMVEVLDICLLNT